MPKPITVTGAILYENHPPPVRGAASFSDGRYYEFSGNVEDGFHFVTAPAWRARLAHQSHQVVRQPRPRRGPPLVVPRERCSERRDVLTRAAGRRRARR